MPSKSAKQHRFMEMIAHNPAAAKRAGVPQKVGRDFVAADKRDPDALHRALKKHTDGMQRRVDRRAR